MKLTKNVKAQIIDKINNFIRVCTINSYIYVEDFEELVTNIQRDLELDSYSDTRYFCKEWLESKGYSIDLGKAFDTSDPNDFHDG